MDVLEAIRNRRSVRAYTEKDVSEATVERLIDAARHAPSAGNIQPWEFVVVRKPEVKRLLSAAAMDEPMIEEAPVVVVVCADEERSGQGYGSRGRTLYCLQDTAAATQNMLLATHALGLGACWIGAFSEEGVREALRVPGGVRPVAIVPVGHPAERPGARLRRPISEIVHRESF